MSQQNETKPREFWIDWLNEKIYESPPPKDLSRSPREPSDEIHVVEILALDKANAEIEKLKDDIENIRGHLLGQTKMSRELLDENIGLSRSVEKWKSINKRRSEEKLKILIDHEYLRGKLTATEALLEKALEALKFYAGEENWHESESYSERLRISYDDCRNTLGTYICGGKAAMKTLKDIEAQRGNK